MSETEKYCINCDKPDDAVGRTGKFCSSCGKKLADKPPLPECNWCGTGISNTSKFCKGCGQDRETALNTRPCTCMTLKFSRLFRGAIP